ASPSACRQWKRWTSWNRASTARSNKRLTAEPRNRSSGSGSRRRVADMKTRKLGPFSVNAIGLGCMSMSHAYGTPDPAEAERTLLAALDIGYNFLDTAALYGFGKNEELIGRVLKKRRNEFVLASKCGIWKDADGKRIISGRPELIREICERSLQRLTTDAIHLVSRPHRGFQVPIGDSVGDLPRLGDEAKMRRISLSEVSAEAQRCAPALHPPTALQTECSLWSSNA